MNHRAIALFLSLVAAVGLCSPVLAAKKKKPSKDGLGPTGIIVEKQKNQLKVLGTQPGSPADGKLKKGDVIVGIGGKRLSSKANEFNPQFARAINHAESETASGKLLVTLAGDREITLQLPVLGSYSATAPYECPKTEKLIRGAADALVIQLANRDEKTRRKNLGSSPTNVALLGLMATGEKKYLDVVSEFMRNYASVPYDGKSLQAKATKQVGTWRVAYAAISLAEYYLLTRDETVMPALKTYTLSLVDGQDAAGLYGHKMVNPLTYRAPGYGQMNQVSIACLMGMMLARKAGVDLPRLDEAIERTQAYVGYHVGKGAFPYGFHGPREAVWNNNGTSGSAAICMALAGDKKGARFFAGSAAASYNTLGRGHASALFSSYWTPAGVNVAGPQATRAFFPKTHPYFTIRRQWDGSFVKGFNEGQIAGVALLTYCLPRRALLITGREADKSIWLNEEEATSAIDMGSLALGDKKPDELPNYFDHAYPQVRNQAVAALEGILAARKRSAADKAAVGDLFPRLKAMLASGTASQQKGAISCFLLACPPEQLKERMDTLAGVLRDKNETDQLRLSAARELGSQGVAMHPYVDDLLSFLLEDRPNDRFAEVDAQLATVIDQVAKGIQFNFYKAGLTKNKELFYGAANRLMQHKRQNARGTGVRMVRFVPKEELHLVVNELDHILRHDDKTYHSYHNPRTAMSPAAEIFVDHDVLEGLGYIVDVILSADGRFSFKMMMLTKTLPKYGAHAQVVIPRLMEDKYVKVMFAQENSRFRPGFEKMVEEIKNSTTKPELVSVAELKARNK